MTGTEPTRSDRPENTVSPRHRPSRYDLLLAVVPAAFLVGILAASLTDVPFRAAISAAAVVGAIALVDGLFINPPRQPGARNGEGPA